MNKSSIVSTHSSEIPTSLFSSNDNGDFKNLYLPLASSIGTTNGMVSSMEGLQSNNPMVHSNIGVSDLVSVFLLGLTYFFIV